MKIAGYEPLTLIDYPDHLATVVFTPGCALRCPYCHNPELITPHIRPSSDAGQTISTPNNYFTQNREQEFFTFLAKRRGLLGGVVITGGEPTLHADLLDFIRRVKELGFLVKLDTNGVFPDTVDAIMRTGLVDYWAMDIKHAPEKYSLATGVSLPLERFRRSVELIRASGVPYEFRTTVVPGIHEVEDFRAIGEWIAGAKSYFLQAFRPTKIADPSILSAASEKSLDLEAIKTILTPYLPYVGIRE